MPTCWVEGVRRAEAKGERAIEWVCGDAEKLPIPDASVDAYTIAFGIRNVTHIQVALEEALRVLKPGGRFLCLEFSRVEAPGLDKIYDIYSMNVLPRIGQMVAGDAKAYRYLAESIRRLQNAFAKMIGEGRPVARAGAQSHRRYRCDAFGVEDMSGGDVLNLPTRGRLK